MSKKEAWVTGTLYLGPEEPDVENWIHVFTNVPDNPEMLGMVERSALMEYVYDLLNKEVEMCPKQ